MRVECWCIGKTTEAYLQQGIQIYIGRLGRYLPFEWVELPDLRKKPSDQAAIRRAEGESVLQRLKADDHLVLLDERGCAYTSEELAAWMEQRLNQSSRRIILLIGGAYGFSPDLYQRAQERWSLSRLTFSHQMIRLFAAEQLYRAMSILKNEPYHNP